jgi:hypothetical protein
LRRPHFSHHLHKLWKGIPPDIELDTVMVCE